MLENKSLANKKVATIYGTITFDGKGQTKELTAAQKKELGKLPGFKFIEGKKEPEKKETSKKTTEKKETTKKQEKTKKEK